MPIYPVYTYFRYILYITVYTWDIYLYTRYFTILCDKEGHIPCYGICRWNQQDFFQSSVRPVSLESN